MARGSLLALVALGMGCSGSQPDVAGGPDAGGTDASSDASAETTVTADWSLSLDPGASAGKVNAALLGHYDLSGALFRYDQVPGLAKVLAPVGFSEWRVGVGRWEAATLLLPTLTDGTACAAAALPPQAFATGKTDLQLITDRDWFTDDGLPVTEAMTLNDGRYSLAYVRSVLDAAAALGAKPYVGIDTMPRALAINRTPSRTLAAWPEACNWTWTNAVSNAPPADSAVFAAATVGMVKRIVEGSGSEPGRAASYWEIWNEAELAYAWNPSFDNAMRDKFFQMAIASLIRLDAYRKASSNTAAKALHFGLGSFAYAITAVGVIRAFDAAPTPQISVDFVSFHSYDNDPMKIVADIRQVTDARKKSAHYQNVELALTEWGPSLVTTVDPTTMDGPLLVSTVIALGATAGLDRAHHTFFYDYYAGIPWGLVDHDLKPQPLYHAYELLNAVVAGGSDRLAPRGFETGELDAGMGAVLATRDAAGKVRVLVINRGSGARTVQIDLKGTKPVPTRVLTFDVPGVAARPSPNSLPVTVPPRAMVLVEL